MPTASRLMPLHATIRQTCPRQVFSWSLSAVFPDRSARSLPSFFSFPFQCARLRPTPSPIDYAFAMFRPSFLRSGAFLSRPHIADIISSSYQFSRCRAAFSSFHFPRAASEASSSCPPLYSICAIFHAIFHCLLSFALFLSFFHFRFSDFTRLMFSSPNIYSF